MLIKLLVLSGILDPTRTIDELLQALTAVDRTEDQCDRASAASGDTPLERLERALITIA